MKLKILKLIFNGLDHSYIIKTKLLESQLRTEVALITDFWEELGDIKYRTADELIIGLVTDGYIELIDKVINKDIWRIELCL